MRSLFSFVSLLVVLGSSQALAGVDITWDACVGNDAAAVNKVFACTGTVNRNYNLQIQYKSPVSIPNFVAVTAYLDLRSLTPGPLAPFWHYETGGCQGGMIAGAALIGTIGAGCTHMLETWGGGEDGVFGIGAYSPDYQEPGRGRFVLLGVRETPYPVNAGDNMWAFQLRFNNRNRPGSPANCEGCEQPAGILLATIRLEGEDATPAVDLMGADKLTDCVAINDAPFAGVCIVDPVERTTWGRLKTMFR